MTKLQLLHRALNERLMAAVEQIMEMVGGTVLEYEEETIRVRKENEVLRRRLRWMEGANPADWPGPSELVTLSTPDESNPALQEECAVSFGYDQDLEPVVIKTEPADIADDALFISPESSLTALPQGTDPGSAGAGVDFGLTDSVNWDSTTSYMAPLDFDPTLPTGVRRWRGGSKRQKMSFACPDCGKVFAKEKRLMFHMRVHSTERPYAYRRRKACFYGDNKRKRKVHSLTQLSKESVDDLSDGSEQTNRSGVSAERHILPIATPVEEQEQDSLSIAESDRTNGDKDPQNSTVKPVPIRHRRKGGRAKMPRCPQCSRVFTRPCRLAVHMKTHAMRKPLTNLPNKEPSGRDETAEKRKLYKKQSMKNNDSEVERARSEGQGLLSCPECKKVFARSCWLSFHMKTHVREKALLRKRLQTDMPVQTELSKEKNKEVVPENGGRTEVHTKKTEEVIKKVFPCPHCDKVFSREGWLKPHIRSHHLQKQNNRSGHLHNLPYHARTRSRRPVIQLPKGTSNAKGVSEELKRKTEESKTASKLKSSDEFSVINDVAKKIINEAIPSTYDHNRIINESKRVPEEIKQDTSDSDEEASQTKCLKERFECKMCNKVYMLEKRLRRHMKIHRGHKLGQDRKKWLIKKQLLKEMRHKEQKQAVASKSSHEKKPKKEEEKAADKKSTSNTNPENTPLMESEDSKIVKEKDIPGNCVCKYCGKAYARKNWLMLHMRGHLKEKAAADEMQKTEGNASKQIPQGSPNKQSFQKGKTRGQGSFPCPFCGKVFAWEMRFLMHMQIHSGEKPYSYRQRKKRFYGDLKRGRVPKVHNEEPLKENSEESEESAEEAMIDDRSAHLSSSPTLASAEAFTSGTETLESSQPVQTSTGSPGLLPQTAFEQPAGASTYSKGNQRTESVSDVISHFSLQPRIVLEPIMTETRYWNSPPRGPNITPGGSERSGLELGQNSCPALVDEMVHVMEDQIIGYNLCTLPVEHSSHGNQNEPGKGYNVISVTDDTEIVCVEVGSPHHVSQMEEELHNMEVQQVSDSFEGNNIGGHQKEVLSYPDVPENSAIDQIPLIVIDDEPEQPVTKMSTIEKSLESPSTTEHNGEGIPTIKSALIQQTTVSESVEPSTHPESSCVVLSDDDNNDYVDDHVLCPSETSNQKTTASLASIQKEKDNKDVSSSIKPPSNVESVIKSLQIDSQIPASDAAVSTKADDLACFQIETSDSTSQQIVNADLECVMSERKDRTSAGVTQTEDRSMSQKKMPCQTCDSIFDGLASLSEHMQVHADKCLPDISDDRLNKKQDVNNQMSESGGDDSADNSEISGKSDISKQNVKTNESSLNKAEPFVKSSEESGVPSDSVTTSQSSKCSAKTAASSGEQKNLKESIYCRFCGKACRKLELHLKRDHMKEHEVVKALSLDKNSEERKRLLNSFAVKKNFKHHRGSKRDHDEDEVVHCIFCQGSYQRKHFREHALTCEQKQPEQIKSSAISSETEETLDTELRNPISDIISSSRLQSLSESSNALSSDINVSTPQITSDLGEHPFPDPIVSPAHWKCDVEPLSPPTLESCPNAEQKAYHLEAERPLISAPKDLDAESLSPPNLDACHSTAVNPPHLESEISLILNAGSSALQNLDAELLEPPILDSCKGTPEQESTVTIPPILNIGSNILQQPPVKDHPQHGVESGLVQQPTSPAPEISSVLNIGSPNKQHAPHQEIKVCSPHNTGDSEVLEPSSQPKEPLTAGPASSIDSSSTPNPESNSPPDLASCSDDAEQTIDSVVERNLFMNSSSSDVQLVPNLKPKSHAIPDPDSCTKEQTPDPQPEIIGSLEPRKSGHQPTVDPELKSNPPLQDIKLRVHEPTSDSESHGCDFHEDPDETVGGTGSDSAVKTQCDSSTSVTSKYKRKRDNQNSSVKEVSKKSHHLQLLADKNALSPSSAEKTSECQTHSWDGKSKLSKINYCFYCKEPHHKMTVHLEAAHPNEPEVAKALSFDKNSKERIKLLRCLQNKGNVLHKTHMAQSSEQDAQPFTEFKTVSSLEDDVICIHCSGLFSKKTFGTHLEQCRGRFSGSAETSCNQVLPNVGPISSSPKPQDPPSNSEQTDAKLESSSFHFVNTTCNTEQLNADPQLGSSSRKDLSCSVEDLDAVVNENVGEDLEPVNADLKLAYSPKENVSADLNSVNSSKESAGHTGVQVSDQEPGNSCRSLTQCDIDQQKAITPTSESSFITAHPESEDALENACKDFSPSHNPYDTSKSKVNAQTHETGRRGRRKKSSHVQNQLLNMDDDFLDEGKSVTPNSKVHACKHCRATFCSPYTLRRHEYTHTGERPFWCHQCNMGFIQKYRLVKHTITYHGDTSLSVDQGKLKRGTRRVHGETSVEDEDNNEKSDRNPEDLPNAVNKCTEQNVASTNQEV